MKLSACLSIMRPRQWLKNLILFFPPLLSGSIFHHGVPALGVVPFAAFCLASSATYLINDVFDAHQDSQHPQKKLRPIPSGKISCRQARLLAGVLLAVALIIGSYGAERFLLFLLLYTGVSLIYTVSFKQLPIVDIFCIAFGFVLRLYAGGEAFKVPISDWLFLTVFLLAAFLSLGKRVSEKNQLGEMAAGHRSTLAIYPKQFLENAMYLTGSAVLVTYSLYAIATPLLVYTVPLCLFGLFRYLLLIKQGGDGDPTSALLKDRALLLTGILWLVLVGLVVKP